MKDHEILRSYIHFICSTYYLRLELQKEKYSHRQYVEREYATRKFSFCLFERGRKKKAEKLLLCSELIWNYCVWCMYMWSLFCSKFLDFVLCLLYILSFGGLEFGYLAKSMFCPHISNDFSCTYTLSFCPLGLKIVYFVVLVYILDLSP